jgi:cell wall assembly regulator SMI1
MWLPGFLPIATDGGGADLFVDLRSGPEHGCVREFDKVYTDGNPRWANVTAMLADIADALANLSAIDGFHPRLDHDGTLHWEYRDLNSR